MSKHEPGFFHGGHCQRKIIASQQDVDILSEPHGRFVNTIDPFGNRVSADHRIRH